MPPSVFSQFPPALTYVGCDDYRQEQNKVTLANILRDSITPVKLSAPRPFKGFPKVWDFYLEEVMNFYHDEMIAQADSDFTNYVYHSTVATPNLKVYFEHCSNLLVSGTSVTSGANYFDTRNGILRNSGKWVKSLPYNVVSGTEFNPTTATYARVADGDFSCIKSFLTNIGNNKSNVYLGNSDQTTHPRTGLNLFSDYINGGSNGSIPLHTKNCGVYTQFLNLIRPYYIATAKTIDNHFLFMDCFRIKADKALTNDALLGKYAILRSDGSRFLFTNCRFLDSNAVDSPTYVFWAGGEFVITDGFFEPIYEFTLDEDIKEFVSISTSGGDIWVIFIDTSNYHRRFIISDGEILSKHYVTFKVGDPNTPYTVDYFRPVTRTTIGGLIVATDSQASTDEFYTVDESFGSNQKFISETATSVPTSIKVAFIVKGMDLKAGFGCIDNGAEAEASIGAELKIAYSDFKLIGSLDHEEISSDMDFGFSHSLPPNDIIRPDYTELTMIHAWSKKPLGYKHRGRYDSSGNGALNGVNVNISDFPYDTPNQEIVLLGTAYTSQSDYNNRSTDQSISKYLLCHGMAPMTWELINAPGASFEIEEDHKVVLNVPNNHAPFYVKVTDSYKETTSPCQGEHLNSSGTSIAPRVSYTRVRVWPKTLPISKLTAGTLNTADSAGGLTNFPQHTKALGADQCFLFDLIGTADEDHHIASVQISNEDVLGVSKGGSTSVVSQTGDLSSPYRLIGKSVGSSDVTFTTITNDITETEKTLTFTVETWDVVQDGTSTIPTTMSVDDAITFKITGNSSYPHQWAISDPTIARFLIDPNDSRIAVLRAYKAGTVHFFVMDSAGIPYISQNITIS